MAFSILATKACKIAYVAGANIKVLSFSNFTLPLKHMPFISLTISFKKDQAKIQAVLDFDNKVNAMISVYAAKLDFNIESINIKAQKIDTFIF